MKGAPLEENNLDYNGNVEDDVKILQLSFGILGTKNEKLNSLLKYSKSTI